jgi:hypothetical protein
MLSDDLLSDRLYAMLEPMPPEFNEIDAILDTLNLSRETSFKLQQLIGSLYLDAIEQAFELGWRLRSDPTPLVFEETQQSEGFPGKTRRIRL